MKKKVIKLDNALSLDKGTLAKLNDEQLSALEGGKTFTAMSCQGPVPGGKAGDNCYFVEQK